MDVRIDIQGTESELVRYHQYWINEDWQKLARIIPQLAALWKMPVKVTMCAVGPDAPPVSETKQDICIFNPDGTAVDLPAEEAP